MFILHLYHSQSLRLTKYVIIYSIVAVEQEIQRFIAPSGTYAFLKDTFIGPRGKAEYDKPDWGGSRRVRSKSLENGRVRLEREDGDSLGVWIIEGSSFDNTSGYSFSVKPDDTLGPTKLAQAMQPHSPFVFLSEAAVKAGMPLPGVDQAKVNELFESVQRTITLGR